MSKPIRSFFSFLLVLQLIIPYSTFAAAVGEFSSVAGNVTQMRAKEVITPVVKSPIDMKDLIVTARTSSATMTFSDDSTITLSENTKLEIKEFLFKDSSRRGIFSLAIGKLTADVKKYIGGDNVFEVYSPTVGVGVRGTGFEFIEALKDGKLDSNMATVTCTDGSLKLSALSAAGEVVSTAVLEAGQVAIIIGGVITISAIGAAVAAAAIAKAAETGAAGAAGGAGAGTGGAAATTGLSTAAIAGIAIGGAAVVGGAAAVAGGGGGGGSSSSSGGTPTPTPTSCSNTTDGRWSGTRSPGCSNDPSDTKGGTWVMNCSSCSCTGTFNGTDTCNCTISGNSMSCTSSGIACGTQNTPCTVYESGTISGNSVSGTYSGSGCNGLSGTWTGAKQ